MVDYIVIYKFVGGRKLGVKGQIGLHHAATAANNVSHTRVRHGKYATAYSVFSSVFQVAIEL
jgi:hypothetical protein